MARGGRTISGIYVPIRLDTQYIKQDFERLKTEMGNLAANMANSIGAAINPESIVKGFGDMTRAIGNVRDAAKGLQQLRPLGDFDKSLRDVRPEIQDLAKTLGITEEAQRKLLTQMAQNTGIKQQVNGLRQLERMLGTTREETLKLAESLGLAIDKAARTRYLGAPDKNTASEVARLAEEYRRLANATSTLMTVGGREEFINTRLIENQIRQFKELHRYTEITAKDYAQIARAAGVSVDAVERYFRAQNKFKEDQALRQTIEQYKELSRLAGQLPTQKGFEDFRLTNEIRQRIDAFKQLNNVTEITPKHYAQIASAAGATVAQVERYVQIQQKLQPQVDLMARLAEQYQKLARGAGETPTAAGQKKFVDSGLIREAISNFKQLHNVAEILPRDYTQIASAAGVALSDVAAFVRRQESLRSAIPTVESLRAEYVRLANATSTLITMSGQSEFIKSGLIQNQISLFRQLHNGVEITAKDYAQIARAAGVAEADVERFIRTQGRINPHPMRQLVEEYRRLSEAAGQARSPESFRRFLDHSRISAAVTAFKQLNPNVQLTARYYQQIADKAGVATSQVRAFIRAQEGLQGRGILGAFTPTNLTAGIQSAMGAMGVVGGMYGVVELIKSMSKASLEMENIKLGFEAIFNESTLAATKLEYVKRVSDQLGLSFITTADGAKRMFAAAKGTEVEKDVENIFYSFSTMGSALKLSGDQMNGVFLALSQMISKSHIAAEELRLQLSERMPGAVQMLATSMGITTRQLDKLLKEGKVGIENLVKFADDVRQRYESGARAASTGLQSELNRVSNAWFDLKRAFVDSDKSAELVRSLGKAMEYLREHASGIATVTKELVKIGGLVLGVTLATKAIMGLAAAFTALKTAVAASSLAGFVAALNPVTATIGVVLGSIAALGYAITTVGGEMTEGEKVVDDYKTKYFDLAAAIQEAERSKKQFDAGLEQEVLKNFENSIKETGRKLRGLFDPESYVGEDEYGQDEVFYGKSMIDKMFDSLQSQLGGEKQLAAFDAFQKEGKSLSEEFMRGLETGISGADLSRVFVNLVKVFNDYKRSLTDDYATDAAKQRFNDLSNVIMNLASKAKDLRVNFEETQKATSKEIKVLEESTAALAQIEKITKTTGTGKESKIAGEMSTMANALVTLYARAEDAKIGLQDLGAGFEEGNEQAVRLQQQVENFDDALPRIAAYAVKNAQDFNTMADGLWNAGVQAGFTYDQLMNLYQAAQLAFNVSIGQGIEKRLQAVNEKITQTKANVKQNTIYTVLTKDMADAGKKAQVFDAILNNQRDKVKELMGEQSKYVDETYKAAEKLMEAQNSRRGGGGGRRSSGAGAAAKQAREAASATKKLASEIENVQKKIASLQTKINDDPSYKYLQEVESELRKIDDLLASSKGPEAERQKLAELRDQYKKYAEERAQQMKDEEQRQRAIDAAQKMSRGYGRLDFDRRAPFEVNEKSLKAQFETMRDEYEKLKKEQLISQEDYTDKIWELTQELNTKIEMANGSLVATIADGVRAEYDKLVDWQDQISDMVLSGINTMSDAFADFFITGMQDSEKLGEAFSKMVSSMISDLAKLFMKMIIIGSIKKLFNLDLGGGGGLFSAKGNVISGGNIGKFTNKVVAGPTIFNYSGLKPFARGGIMGEAGPEAVMPLIRTRGGNLGVRAEGGYSTPEISMNQKISVNIHNSTDSNVSTRQDTDSSGNVDIQVMIDKAVAKSMKTPGTATFGAMQNTWGGMPALAQR